MAYVFIVFFSKGQPMSRNESKSKAGRDVVFAFFIFFVASVFIFYKFWPFQLWLVRTESVGDVVSIELLGGSFPVTNVTTAKGTFRVSGSVIGSATDKASVHIYFPDLYRYFCIESQIKPQCYRIQRPL